MDEFKTKLKSRNTHMCGINELQPLFLEFFSPIGLASLSILQLFGS